MIGISSNDTFIENKILTILSQKEGFLGSPDQDTLHKINIQKNFKNLTISFNKEKINVPLPINVNELFKILNNFLHSFELKFGEFVYAPFRQTVQFKGKEVFLRNTHNIILRSLLMAKDVEGINKKKLYQIVWPNDKEMQINKLDTHITNIKNFLSEEINLQIKIFSEKNKIKLLLVN